MCLCGKTDHHQHAQARKENTNGIGFALSASDLMTVLRRFNPNAQFAASEETVAVSSGSSPIETPVASENSPATASAPPQPERSGIVSITSDPDGAELFVDDKFFGDAPATLRLSVGSQSIILKIPGRPDWRRTLEVLEDNRVTLKAAFNPVF